jgi:probable UDP-sugar transporter A4
MKFRLRDQIYITEVGFLMMCIYCVFSGLSGVCNEYLLKRNYSDSIYLQNSFLYAYGCVFNFVAYFLESSLIKRGNEGNFGGFFSGFSVFTWAIIGTQVLNGFMMSVVMKHSNNITRLFVISCSLVVTTVLSVLVFSLKLNAYFYFCFSIIMFALYLYVI